MFTDELVEQLQQYIGKWVALEKSDPNGKYDTILAVGDTPKEVFDLTHNGVLFYVPDPTMHFYYQASLMFNG